MTNYPAIGGVHYGAMASPHGASRACYRCGKELTDAASKNVGVGPICRKLDNAVLARQIPVNVEAAPLMVANLSSVWGSLPANLQIPEIASTMTNLLATLGEGVQAHGDYRKTVQRVEWILSFGVHWSVKQALEKLVKCLGYVALVALWNGEAATGKAEIGFGSPFPTDTLACANRLWIKAPRNKGGAWALKSIPGRAWHPTVKAWSVPAEQAEKFALTVKTHYPNHDPIALVLAIAAAETFAYKPEVAPGASVLPADVAAKAAALGFPVQAINAAMSPPAPLVDVWGEVAKMAEVLKVQAVGSGKPIQCGKCGAAFINAVGLAKHACNPPIEPEPFHCGKCGFTSLLGEGGHVCATAPTQALVVLGQSISDDDLCATCQHCEYNPGDTSFCGQADEDNEPAWPGEKNGSGYYITCLSYEQDPDLDAQDADDEDADPDACEECGQSYMKGHADHCSMHHDNEVKDLAKALEVANDASMMEVHKCAFCGQKFKTIADLLAHDTTHDAARHALLVGKGTTVKPPSLPVLPPSCTICECLTGEGEMLVVTTPFDKGFVEALKTLPKEDRQWVGFLKAWCVRAKHLEAVKALLVKFYAV